ncbi:MAG: hypothetical protein K2X50_05370 [Gammaproteobacteria bacterium]|nr:hypothetical protein [Gammaproteobacteria bacterium]
MKHHGELEKKPKVEEKKISFLTRYKQKFTTLFKSNFFPDGYDEIKGKYTYPNIPTEIKNDTSEFWMYFVAFLGLPSRPKAFLNRERKVVHQLTWGQFLKNLIGGLDFAKDTSSTKKYLQLIGIFPIPIKIGVILLFKLVTFPFKFLLNIVKLMILVLVPILLDILDEIGGSFIGIFDYLAEKLPLPLNYILTLISFILTLVLFLVLLPLYVASFTLSLVAGIALAPLSWTRTVYNYFSYTIIASIFALFTLAVAATVWAIALPFVITGILALFPSLMGVVTFVTHIPVIASVLAAYTATFLGVSASIGTLFLPYITALTGLFGITLSTAVVSIASAATIGIMAALIAVPACYIADTLSDRWADWHTGGLLYAILAAKAPKTTRITYTRHYSDTEFVELVETGSKKTQQWQQIPVPSESEEAVNLKRAQQRGFGKANGADTGASKTWQRYDTGDFETGDTEFDAMANHFLSGQTGKAPMGQRVEVLDEDAAQANDFN